MEGQMGMQTDGQTTADITMDKQEDRKTDGWQKSQTDGLRDR